MHQVTVRTALIADQKSLEALQWRASLENSGDREALLANPELIELPLQQIEAGGVFVAEVANSIKGFAAMLPLEDGNAELDSLFVEPEFWRHGIGRILLEHCCVAAKISGAAEIHVIANPHAEGFYNACGFEKLGLKQMQFGIGLLMKRTLL
jgi:N-acetylglutamate synthase-like GNAT family acetyltransferase